MGKTALQETTYCDFNHAAVSTLAKKLADGETDTKKITEATFKHVRDNIRFGCDLVQVKASETLAKGYGACWNKALLLVALLRSNKIPARMAFNLVKKEFMRPPLGEACETLHETENHCFALVWLTDKWIAVDATLDAPTYQKFYVPHNVAWGIDWNGEEDMRLYTENIAGPIGFFEDIDAAIQQDVGYLMPSPSEAEAYFAPLNQGMWQD
ncbi:MAG TPA: transglutaminase family protein [Negativicutes bacterium]|jgi:transglutaminase-like putative cysteine protease